jgi:hypothetical protein
MILGEGQEYGNGNYERNSHMIIITNAFSINMLSGTAKVNFEQISTETARTFIKEADDIISAIGHDDTANIVGGILGIEVNPNRMSVQLTSDETLLVAQYTGPRLPEGATTLPEGATINFWLVSKC